METLKKYWNISEVSVKIGVNKPCIRFWEKEFCMSIKRFSKNERRYTEADIKQLQKIKRFVNTSRLELLNMFEQQNKDLIEDAQKHEKALTSISDLQAELKVTWDENKEMLNLFSWYHENSYEDHTRENKDHDLFDKINEFILLKTNKK